MKKKTRPILMLLLVAAMSVASLAGCGPAEQDGVTKLTMYIATPAPTVSIQNTAVGKRILEELNVELDIEYGVGDVDSRLTLMMFSGDYPDIIVPNSQDNQKRLIQKNALIDMKQYFDGAGSGIYDAYDCGTYNLMDMIVNSVGGAYYLPYLMAGGQSTNIEQAFYIQSAVLEEAGYPEVKTLDEYFTLIENYQKKHPQISSANTIGFTMQNETSDAWRFDNITNPVLGLNGYQNDGGWFVDLGADNKYTVRSQSGSDEEYEYFKKLNECYRKGLVDREFLTQKYDDWAAKMSSGRVLGYFGWGYEMPGINSLLAEAGMTNRSFVPVRLLNAGVTKDRYNSKGLHDISRGMGITKNCRHPEAAVKFLNAMLREDIYKLRKWGIEGEDYEVDASGAVVMDKTRFDYYNDGQTMDRRGLAGGTFLGFPERPFSYTFSNGMAAFPSLDPAYQSYMLTDYDKAYLEKYGLSSYSEMFDDFEMPYGYAYTIANGFDAGSDERKIMTAKDDVRLKYVTMLVRAGADNVKAFDEVWSEYKGKLEGIGYGGMPHLEERMALEVNRRIEEGRFA